MVTAHAWADGTEYKGQAEHDDFDFCTVGEVTYMCRVSHAADPSTHPTQGEHGGKTWERAAWAALNGLSAAAGHLATAVSVVEFSSKRLAPASMNAAERERFTHLSGVLKARTQTLADEIERMLGDHQNSAPSS
ncbi:hypothetical protein [Streptomyces heilongjiangensis]|uniref:Uncharacterized protein n=1 Tax=Streptomyces heilongjiangensis TaxID=945052 RepID=A0ABW1BHV1_9ACTN|nr:hypothetical protein [Streptomyces heilongjiangensis]MDC2951056.1 hypothetical protein [Streptomyces heilongjiangensis]